MERISQLLLTFLLNACWQVALIAAVGALCAWLLRDWPARYRHWLWVVTLIGGFCLPALSSLQLASDSPLKSQPPLPAVQPQIPVYLVFDNQKYRIDKDQFIIGRGTKSSDLPIKDGNISRKHAAVIRRNGTYFIKDLGSTNGIDFKGMRIDNKRIEEGDIFHLCDYELRFTFKR